MTGLELATQKNERRSKIDWRNEHIVSLDIDDLPACCLVAPLMAVLMIRFVGYRTAEFAEGQLEDQILQPR